MPVSADRMYLQMEDGTLLAMRAVDGIIQVSSNGSEWTDLTSGASVLTDGVTLDGDGTIDDPLTALPSLAFDWRARLLYKLQQLYPAVGFNNVSPSVDCTCLLTDLVAGTPSGSGNAVMETTTNGGTILTSTGATNNSACVVRYRGFQSDGTTEAVFIANSRTQPWAVYARAQVVAAAGATGKFNVIAGLLDITNDNYLGAHGATSAANWSMVIGGSGTDLGVASDLLVHDFLLVNDGTNIKAYLGDTIPALAQIGASVAVAGVATAAGYPRWYDANGTTGANVSHRTIRHALVCVKA